MTILIKKLLILIILMFIYNTIFTQTNVNYVDERGFIVKIGDFAEDFYIEYADGRKSIKLSKLKGKVVMLQFTASWCGVCRREMPHIEKEIWRTYKNKGLIVIGIDLKETIDEVKSFAKIMKITYPLALDEDGSIFTLFAHKNAGVTRNVLIDKKGKIVFLTRLYKKTEFKKLINKIDFLVNE